MRRREEREFRSCGPCRLMIVGDARTGKGEEALRQEVQQDVVTPEGRGLAVPVPIRFADDLVDAVLFRPACRDLLGAGSAAV